MKNVVILISGRGSNMQAIVEAKLKNVNVCAVISNKASAQGLIWAQAQNIATHSLEHTSFETRADFDQALQHCIDQYQPDLVVLAGFMRILTPEFTAHYQNRLINIHPSLLPAFTGLHTHRRALEMGCKFAGCTTHFVTAELDYGPIISQAVVTIADSDTEESLAQKVLREEHRLYSQAVEDFCNDRFIIEGLKVRVKA